MKVEILKKADNCRLKGSLHVSPEINPYRRYKLLSSQQKADLFVYDLLHICRQPSGCLLIAREGRNILGAAALHSSGWDSRHFGVRMACIERFFCNSAAASNQLLGNVIQECRRQKIRHLSCKIEQPDFCSINCLEGEGFKMVDAKLTYVFYGQRQRIPPLKELFPVREFRRGDLKSLVNIVKDRFWINRFYTDPFFDKSKAVSFYVKWLKNCCRFKCADMVLVAQRAGIPVGFFTFLQDKILLKAGIKCWGRGIAAVSPDAPGAYVSLLKEALRRGHELGIDIGEFDTQISNFPVIRLYQRVGMEFVKSSFWFHKPLNL
ncbi:MAG: GNAT family N-acetyltransferase [Candidatus Omnitrophica bacterium]|nr:GNAT family N-acetyltransferase [Candidatus Omnitrophota bacterium]MDD5771562.1 GNAT family N-acetyltransferase [Candidatus Omnitrophota bacterium]